MKVSAWTCDSCHEPIKNPKRALVTWRLDDENRAFGFAIVHKMQAGTGDEAGAAGDHARSVDLARYLGPVGQAALLSLLSRGPMAGVLENAPQVKDFDGFVDLFRRLQTPGYEQARGRFADEDVQRTLGHVEDYYPYVPAVLSRINERTL